MPSIRDTAGQDRALTSARRFDRRWLLGAAAAVAVVGLMAAVAGGWLSASRSVDAARLRVAEVTRGPLVRDIVVNGRLISAQSPTLYAIAPGTVSLKVVAGDAVTRDQPLAVIESPALESELAQERASVARLETEVARAALFVKQRRTQARMRLEQAEIDHKAATRELQSIAEGHAQGVMSELDVLRAKDALEKAEIELAHAGKEQAMQTEVAGFELDAKKLELERQRAVADELARRVEALTIRSPVNGQVGQVHVAQRANVAANAPIVSVVDLTAFELEVQVPESFARDLVVGMEAEITGGGVRYAGKVRAVSPEVVAGVVVSRIELAGELPPDLRQNQRMTARILLDRKDDVLQVERGPFFEAGGGHAYFVTDGVAERRPLRTGIASMDAVEILSGARPGDRIVVSGADLFDGADRVRIAD